MPDTIGAMPLAKVATDSLVPTRNTIRNGHNPRCIQTIKCAEVGTNPGFVLDLLVHCWPSPVQSRRCYSGYIPPGMQGDENGGGYVCIIAKRTYHTYYRA